MWQRVKRSLTFSNVIALMALFFALGGTVYAAGRISGAQIKPKSIPANRIKPKSISSQQIKPGAIASGLIKEGSISATQIAPGSLTGAQVKPGSLTGAQVVGSTLTGVTAASIGSVQYVTAVIPVSTQSPVGTPGTAVCPAGTRVIGGGATLNKPAEAFVNESAPAAERNGWYANSFAFEPGITETITAICTPVAAPVG